jgi:hypothetical protein
MRVAEVAFAVADDLMGGASTRTLEQLAAIAANREISLLEPRHGRNR